MINNLTIALAQLNPTVGALEANFLLAKKTIIKAEQNKVDILLFSELFLTGYFPEDLLLKPQFVKDAIEKAKELASLTKNLSLSVILPTIWQENEKLYNGVIVAENGKIRAVRYKYELPNDDVFYEKRYFSKPPLQKPAIIKGIKIGLPICEDIWHDRVCKYLAQRGAELLLCPNGSPYWKNKHYLRQKLVRQRIKETSIPLLYLNQVGGQDELVFDGASFGMNERGELVFEAHSFKEDFAITKWLRKKNGWHFSEGEYIGLVSVDEAPYRACILGLRDYLHKNGFTKAVLGLSGGIDSALVATMAVDAIGKDNVHCVMMPYKYTSEESLRDAKQLADNLGVRYDIIPIEQSVKAVNSDLFSLFAGLPKGVSEENIQSRIRGIILMAISNKFGSMLITTGNKSEMAVGYATIYGDMNGGFNPIKDMSKMQIYHFANWRNNNLPDDVLGKSGKIIPQTIIDRAPSAELSENQLDQDSLPPYELLDGILEALIEKEMSIKQIVALGYDYNMVKRVEKMVYNAEYKRRQAPPGVKLTKKAFGIGRKYPITNGYRDKTK